MNENTKKRIRTRGRSNAVLRRTQRIHARGGPINNSIEVQERDKILKEN